MVIIVTEKEKNHKKKEEEQDYLQNHCIDLEGDISEADSIISDAPIDYETVWNSKQFQDYRDKIHADHDAQFTSQFSDDDVVDVQMVPRVNAILRGPRNPDSKMVGRALRVVEERKERKKAEWYNMGRNR